jgi:peptidyl-prolyl cis-trans isomerase D
MLQTIRDRFLGTFAVVLLAMIGLSFVFFGLDYSFIGSGYAAKVDGEKIGLVEFEQEYRDALQRNPQLASLSGDVRTQVRRSLLDQLISRQLIENYLDANNFRVSDEQVRSFIREQEVLQTDGKFDREAYQAFLAERGLDARRFEQLQREALRQQQLQLSIAATAVVTPAEYRRYLNLIAEQRVVTVASIDSEDVSDEIKISDEMIAAYYENHPDEFQLPEEADVRFIQISRDAVAEDVAVSDEAIEAYYAENRDRWLQDEQRRARHILILSGDDDTAARATAESLLQRVKGGEDFADVARETSEDTVTAEQGGDLGSLTRSQLPSELGSEIFSMDEGELKGPVKSEFGYHVIQLDEIREPGPLPLAEVRGELLAELRQSEAENLYAELERTLSDALFESSSLEEVAEATGLGIETANGITRSGGEPFGSNQAAIDAIFEESVLSGERLSDVVELDADRAAIFKVVAHREAKRRPLDEVRDDVVAALEAEQAELLMSSRAEQMLEALKGGEDFGVAAETAGLEVAEPQMLTRTTEDVDQSLLFDVFAAGKPTNENPVFGRVDLRDGSHAVYKLEAVLPGRPESVPLAERDQGKLMLAQDSGIGDFQAFVRSLQDEADVVINEDVVAADDLFQ